MEVEGGGLDREHLNFFQILALFLCVPIEPCVRDGARACVFVPIASVLASWKTGTTAYN